MSKEEYNQLTIEEKAFLMECILEDEDFKTISSIAFSKIICKLSETIQEKE